METELSQSSSEVTNRNPFRRSEAAPTLSYFIQGRKAYITPLQYQAFQTLFVKCSNDGDFITDKAVVDILQLSKLSEDELADLWEDALKATFVSVVTAETRLGFLSKNELFVLLSELQAKLKMTHERFSDVFLPIDMAAEPRRNPFKRGASNGAPVLPIAVIESLPSLGNPMKSENTDQWRDLPTPAEKIIEGPISTQTLSPVSYSSFDAFGTSAATTSPVNPATPIREDDMSASKILGKDDKELALRIRPLNSTDQNYPPLELVPGQLLPWLTGVGPGEIEAVIPATTTMDSDMSNLERESSTPKDTPDLNSKNLSTAPTSITQYPFHPSSRVVVEAEAPVSTSASDDLALHRLTAIRSRDPELPPRPEKKQSFSRRLLTKAHLSKPSKGQLDTDPNNLRPQFSLRLLSQALLDAASEGNLPLVASLVNLGANVNFSSLDPLIYHFALGVAVEFGHSPVVDYLIVMGSNEASIHQAFMTSFNNCHSPMAIRLVPQLDMYSLEPFLNPVTDEIILISPLGQVAKNTTVPGNHRERVLGAMLEHQHFRPTKVVYEVREKDAPTEDQDKKQKKDVTKEKEPNSLLTSKNTIQLLISRLDVSLVGRINTTTAKTTPERMFNDWMITAEEWQGSPQRALEMLQLLIAKSAPLDNKTETQARPAMTPLAHAVAGGSLEAVRLLLEHNADPECSVYETDQPEKQSTDAYTALGWAARQGRVDLCQQLVGAGAIPWRAGAFNRSPLYWASRYGHFEVVEDLLFLDTNRSSIDTCLIAAIEGNDPRIAKILLESGAVINTDTWEAAMSCQPKPQERSKHREIIDLLLANQHKRIHAEAIACAINSKNFAGLSRVLEKWNELSSDPDISMTYIQRGPKDKRRISCVKYAEHKGASDFVSLLSNYQWVEGQMHQGL